MPEVANPDASTREIVKSGRYERTDQAGILTGQLKAIAALDQLAKGKATTFYIIGGVLLLGAFISFVCNLVPFGLVAAIAGIFGIVHAISWSKFNVPDERHELADKLLGLVSRDSDPALPISLKLGLGALASKANQIVGPKVSARNDRNYFQEIWLQLRGSFLDKTQYSISVSESLQVKHRKSKRKPKGYLITLLLAYPKKRYGKVTELAQKAQASVQLPSEASLKSVRVTERAVRICVKLPPPVALASGEHVSDRLYKTITMMLLSAYQLLNAARASDKFPGSSGG